VANPFHKYNVKFRDSATVEWKGGIMITLNDTVESIRHLPQMDSSMLDKGIILRVKDTGIVFPPNNELEATIEKELPFFGKWLLDHNIPDKILGKNRFGIASFHHPEIMKQANALGPNSQLAELLDMWIGCYAADHAIETEWVGSTSQLQAHLLGTEIVREIARSYCRTPDSFGRKLANLAADRPELISKLPTKNGYTRWRIPLPRATDRSVFNPE
jgi:hypothetical protein